MWTLLHNFKKLGENTTTMVQDKQENQNSLEEIQEPWMIGEQLITKFNLWFAQANAKRETCYIVHIV